MALHRQASHAVFCTGIGIWKDPVRWGGYFNACQQTNNKKKGEEMTGIPFKQSTNMSDACFGQCRLTFLWIVERTTYAFLT